ncbi:MAG: SBBP repeat-containing protein [Bacteroidota bacterium]|nr:SBBP repeat-containing protein [Bacteroidota bacterium]
MIRKLLAGVVAGIFIFCPAIAQINVQWVGRYTSAGNNIDRAKSMVIDPSGNSFVVGTSWNGSNFDIATIKLDANGNQQWATYYNGPGNGYDEARAIVTDALGNVYVTGYSLGTNYDIVTIMYDPSGVQQWATRFNGTANGFDEGYDIAVDTSGNVYITGGTVSTTSNLNYITIKYNSAGAQQWATLYSNTNNSTNTECAYALTLDATGNVYVTGTSYAGTSFDHDIATIKYNNAGAQQWVSRYNGPGSVFDAGNDIVVNAANEVFVAGYARDLVGTTNYSYVTIRINAAGVQQWASIYNGPGNDYDAASALTLTPAGNIAITGRSLGTTSTAEDAATILYDSAGSVIWVRRYDGGVVNYDEGVAVAADSSNRIFVTGYSYKTGTNNDYLTIKYEANGDTSWIVKYNGTATNSDQSYAIAIGPTSEIYVGGMSKGLGSNEDFTVVKYCQLTTTSSADTLICLGSTANLLATGSYGAVDSIWWTPTAGLNQSNIANPVATPSVTTTYVAHLKNQYGCIDLDTTIITVIPLPGPQIQAGGPTSFCVGGSVVLTAIDTNNTTVTYQWNTGDTTAGITADSAALYSVTMTNAAGCSGISSVSITINPNPTINAGSDVGFCQSTTVPLCATGGVTYAWTPAFGLSDTTIACPTAGPTSSTTYIVYGTDANGCSSSDTVSVNLYPVPSIPVISRNVAVLTSTSAFSYQWYFNSAIIPGATSQTYTPTLNGNYYVVTTDTNGCAAFSGTYSMMDVSIRELSATNPVNLYPNPNNGNFSVQLDQKGMSGLMEIYNVNGQKVYAQQLSSNGIVTIDFNLEAEAGIYFLRVVLEDGSVLAQRMIIE